MICTLQFGLGIILAVTAATILFEGGVFGEMTTGIAIVMGITGIALIATSKIRLLSRSAD